MPQYLVTWSLWLVGTIAALFFILHVLGLFMFFELSYHASPGKGLVAFHNDFRRCWIIIDVPIVPERRDIDAKWECAVSYKENVVRDLCLTASHILDGHFGVLVGTEGGSRGGYSLIMAHPVVYLPCTIFVFIMMRYRLRFSK